MTLHGKILKIMLLALQINSCPTQQEKTGFKPTIFVSFSGHVNQLDVSIHTKGWHSPQLNDEQDGDTIYLGYDNTEEKLDSIIEKLEKIQHSRYDNRPIDKILPAIDSKVQYISADGRTKSGVIGDVVAINKESTKPVMVDFSIACVSGVGKDKRFLWCASDEISVIETEAAE